MSEILGTEVKLFNTNNKAVYLTPGEWRGADWNAMRYTSHNREMIFLHDDGRQMLRLAQFGLNSINGVVNGKDKTSIEGALVRLEVPFSIRSVPPGYYKMQRSWLYYIEISLFHNFRPQSARLVSFGNSYGEVEFNGVKAPISHSGGTICFDDFKDKGEYPEEVFGGIKWVDTASQFNLIGDASEVGAAHCLRAIINGRRTDNVNF